MSYHLIAFAVDAISCDRARVEWAVATQDANGDWYDWNGQKLYPFWTTDFGSLDLGPGFVMEDMPIPNGWIEHIHSLAQHDLHNRAPAFDLATALGLHEAKPTKPFPRRI